MAADHLSSQLQGLLMRPPARTDSIADILAPGTGYAHSRTFLGRNTPDGTDTEHGVILPINGYVSDNEMRELTASGEIDDPKIYMADDQKAAMKELQDYQRKGVQLTLFNPNEELQTIRNQRTQAAAQGIPLVRSTVAVSSGVNNSPAFTEGAVTDMFPGTADPSTIVKKSGTRGNTSVATGVGVDAVNLSRRLATHGRDSAISALANSGLPIEILRDAMGNSTLNFVTHATPKGTPLTVDDEVALKREPLGIYYPHSGDIKLRGLPTDMKAEGLNFDPGKAGTGYSTQNLTGHNRVGSNPYGFPRVMLHELGHKLDYRMHDVEARSGWGDVFKLHVNTRPDASGEWEPDPRTEGVADAISFRYRSLRDGGYLRKDVREGDFSHISDYGNYASSHYLRRTPLHGGGPEDKFSPLDRAVYIATRAHAEKTGEIFHIKPNDAGQYDEKGKFEYLHRLVSTSPHAAAALTQHRSGVSGELDSGPLRAALQAMNSYRVERLRTHGFNAPHPQLPGLEDPVSDETYRDLPVPTTKSVSKASFNGHANMPFLSPNLPSDHGLRDQKEFADFASHLSSQFEANRLKDLSGDNDDDEDY